MVYWREGINVHGFSNLKTYQRTTYDLVNSDSESLSYLFRIRLGGTGQQVIVLRLITLIVYNTVMRRNGELRYKKHSLLPFTQLLYPILIHNRQLRNDSINNCYYLYL